MVKFQRKVMVYYLQFEFQSQKYTLLITVPWIDDVDAFWNGL